MYSVDTPDQICLEKCCSTINISTFTFICYFLSYIFASKCELFDPSSKKITRRYSNGFLLGNFLCQFSFLEYISAKV